MNAVFAGPVVRYKRRSGFVTSRDPFDDLLVHLEFLTARDSAAEFLRKADDSEKDIEVRASAVSTHAKAARAFIEQAKSTSDSPGFVSAYYAALNLAKICILFSPHYGDLKANRYHGVTYNPTVTPASLADDTLELKNGGTIPLYYEVLTGEKTRATTIHARDIYCLIADISTEWGIATGGTSWIATLSFRSLSGGEGTQLTVSAASGLADPLTLGQLCALRQVEPVHGHPGVFRSVRKVRGSDAEELFDEILDPRLLYYPYEGGGSTPIGNLAGLLPVEEFPLILAIYHMSSVARYNPEFMDSIRSSRYWPVVAALKNHGLYKLLLLTWSFVTQTHVAVSRA